MTQGRMRKKRKALSSEKRNAKGNYKNVGCNRNWIDIIADGHPFPRPVLAFPMNLPRVLSIGLESVSV
jgi:hypothetical protein